MTNPPYEAREILRVLHRHMQLGTVRLDIPATFLGYKDVLDELHWTRNRDETWGKALERQGLDQLAIWARDEQHPAVTGLIIDRTTNQPGPGYFRLYGKRTDDRQWWLEQVGASLEYPWGRYVTASDPIAPPPSPQARDLAEPPDRVLTTTYRVLRDTELARRVKELHQCRCQLCSERIDLRDRDGYYAEGHHVQPLGQPHNGPDVMGNIMCVCPNCHAKLDFGAIPLEPALVRRAGHHVVEQAYIDYHNLVIYGGGAGED
jgi:hypothetical protein